MKKWYKVEIEFQNNNERYKELEMQNWCIRNINKEPVYLDDNSSWGMYHRGRSQLGLYRIDFYFLKKEHLVEFSLRFA